MQQILVNSIVCVVVSHDFGFQLVSNSLFNLTLKLRGSLRWNRCCQLDIVVIEDRKDLFLKKAESIRDSKVMPFSSCRALLKQRIMNSGAPLESWTFPGWW